MNKNTWVVGSLALLLMTAIQAAEQKRRISFAELDRNGDGRVSVTEANASPKLNRAFATADRDRDDYISEREFQAWIDSLAQEKSTTELASFDTATDDMVRIEPPRPERW
jgi:Ca2+-binding EF-hand superfamily protein